MKIRSRKSTLLSQSVVRFSSKVFGNPLNPWKETATSKHDRVGGSHFHGPVNHAIFGSMREHVNELD